MLRLGKWFSAGALMVLGAATTMCQGGDAARTRQVRPPSPDAGEGGDATGVTPATGGSQIGRSGSSSGGTATGFSGFGATDDGGQGGQGGEGAMSQGAASGDGGEGGAGSGNGGSAGSGVSGSWTIGTAGDGGESVGGETGQSGSAGRGGGGNVGGGGSGGSAGSSAAGRSGDGGVSGGGNAGASGRSGAGGIGGSVAGGGNAGASGRSGAGGIGGSGATSGAGGSVAGGGNAGASGRSGAGGIGGSVAGGGSGGTGVSGGGFGGGGTGGSAGVGGLGGVGGARAGSGGGGTSGAGRGGTSGTGGSAGTPACTDPGNCCDASDPACGVEGCPIGAKFCCDRADGVRRSCDSASFDHDTLCINPCTDRSFGKEACEICTDNQDPPCEDPKWTDACLRGGEAFCSDRKVGYRLGCYFTGEPPEGIFTYVACSCDSTAACVPQACCAPGVPLCEVDRCQPPAGGSDRCCNATLGYNESCFNSGNNNWTNQEVCINECTEQSYGDGTCQQCLGPNDPFCDSEGIWDANCATQVFCSDPDAGYRLACLQSQRTAPKSYFVACTCDPDD